MADSETLFAFYNNMMRLFLAAAVMAVAMGLAFAEFSGRSVVKPITQLSDKLQNTDPNSVLKLEKSNVIEIDSLSSAMMKLNRDVIESATKLSKVLQMAGRSIGVSEMRDDSELAYCSNGVFTLLNREELQSANNYIPKEVCMQMVAHAKAYPADTQIYRVGNGMGERFIRIQETKEGNTLVGTILDVTTEMENRRKLEQERDHDLLTGILNRRAFEAEG